MLISVHLMLASVDNNNTTNSFFGSTELTIIAIAVILAIAIGVISLIFVSIKLIKQLIINNPNRRKNKIIHSEIPSSKNVNTQTESSEIKETTTSNPENVQAKEDKSISTPKSYIEQIEDALTKAEQAIKNNNIENAKESYIEAKTIYFNSNLDYEQKSKFYNKVIEINDQINKKTDNNSKTK